jgi:hypothetical protein
MSILKAFANGAAATLRRPRLLALLWVINVVYAAAIVTPLALIVQTDLGHSFLGSNIRPLDAPWLAEAALKYGGALPAMGGGLVLGVVLFLGLYVFLNGGIVGRLLDREGRPTLTAFVTDCARYFGRYVRLFLLSLVFLALTFGVVLRLLSALIAPFIENARTEWTTVILSNLHLLAALLLLSAVHMVFDYAKIAVVADDEKRSLKALGHALKFLKNRFFRAWALYLLVVAVFLAGTVACHIVLGRLSGPASAAVVLGFLWMQASVVFRIWVKTLFFAAQAEFYRAHPY